MAKIDIFGSILNIKQLIKQAKIYSTEQGLRKENVPQDIINGIKQQTSNVLDSIQTYLILSSSQGIFYGLCLTTMSIIQDFSINGFIDSNPEKSPIELVVNPFYIENLSLNDMIGLIKIEIEKLIYLHPDTYKKLNPGNDPSKHESLEVGSSVSATELFYSDVASGENKFTLPDYVYTRSDLTKEISKQTTEKQTIEYYYMAHLTNKKNSYSEDGTSSSFGGISFPGTNGKPIHQWETMKNFGEATENVKTMVSDVTNELSNSGRGYIPGCLKTAINRLFEKPEISWKQVLKHYLGIYPYGYRNTKTRLNRRQPTRTDLCGRLTNRRIRIVIGIDTSGSMGSDEIFACLNEIYAIAKDYQTDITVIECDAQIGKIYKVKNKKDIQRTVTGRGGTSYIPVIDYINKNNYKDALLIYFTDGFGDNEIPKPRTFKNMWVVLKNATSLSLDNPFGEVKTLYDKYGQRF